MDMKVIMIAAAAAVSFMAIAYGVLYSRVESEKKTANRVGRISNRDSMRSADAKANDNARRKKNIQQTVKDLEKTRTDKNKLSLPQRLKQAGLTISPQVFYLFSAVAGILFAAAGFIFTKQPLIALGLLFVGGLGAPRWFLSFKTKRRVKAFIDEFPNAIEAMARGIKSGLPLNDSMRMVANEAKDPLASEFKTVLEAVQLGVPMGEAITRLASNIRSSETNFFAIVISIQQGSGGSLSEALGNLAKVLRDRKKMEAKVKAVSSEAKTSAMIIGAMPLGVSLVLYLMNGEYLMLLFTTSGGNIVLAVAATMYAMGTFIMRQMVNFEI